MNEKIKASIDEETDDLTVIDATVEESRVNVLDATLGDDDFNEDDIYDGYYDEKVTEPYAAALRAVIFGCLSIILPLFAWMFTMFNSVSLAALALSVTGVVFGIVGLVSSRKCHMAPRASLSEGMAKVGRLVSIIGLAVSALVLVYVIVNMIIFIITLICLIAFYSLYIILMAVSAILGYA